MRLTVPRPSPLRLAVVGLVLLAVVPSVAVALAWRNGLILLAVAGLALAAAWFGSEIVLLRRVRRLLAATRRLEAGDLSARAGLGGRADELGQLAEAFDAMAARLQATMAALDQDVAERRRAERAHAASEARLRALVSSAMDAIISVDQQHRIVLFNPAAEQMFGYQAAEVLGRPLDVLLPERFHAVHRGAMERFGRTGETTRAMDHQQTLAARRASGEEFPIEASISSAVVDGVRIFSVIVRDVSERLQAEASLRQAERQAFEAEKLQALGAMAGGIAHNLNQVLGLVGGYSELACEALRRSPPDVAGCLEMLDIVAESAYAGGETVKRLLTYARNPDDAPFERIDAAALLDEVARLTAPRWREMALAEGRRIELTLLVTGRPVVRGRPADLREALTNLIFNAVDALPNGGSIALAAEIVGREVCLTVADTGTGIPEGVRQRIFEPFFTTKRERGTGLGLPTVARVLDQHGGRVTVESAPGRGTTIRLFLPSAAGAAVPAGVAPGSVPASEAPGGDAAGAAGGALARLPAARTNGTGRPAPLRVLTVDDDPALARMIALMLEQAGHAAQVATSATDALARLGQEPYDLVISDLSMGEGMDGWELAETVRTRWPGTRVVLATGWGAAVDPVRARRVGIEAVISKPFRRSALEPLLRNGRAGGRH